MKITRRLSERPHSFSYLKNWMLVEKRKTFGDDFRHSGYKKLDNQRKNASAFKDSGEPFGELCSRPDIVVKILRV
jgi:hypothetical protein